MTTSPLLSNEKIELLLTQQPISDRHPWVTCDEAVIDDYLRNACDAIERTTGARSHIEWGHYGSGYASFVDAWFYKDTPEFDVARPRPLWESHVGLVVLLSRLSPYFVFMEGEKHWHLREQGSYLPAFDMLDRLENKGVQQLAKDVQPVLESYGLARATRIELSDSLPPGTYVPTILNDRGHTQFDALFYWED
ncbi:hypothetical protein GQ57_37930 [Burkholderia sp. MSh2]|uniref:hypothetical protein n=1 Tax=Burkholderia TaxID=32008 RepID=UPI0004D4713A|nr:MULTISPECIES: hypothetical protein [Burkholderia]KEZ00951.1 hypothetical protein GQ57_37930 [Burkholderia sp. MSh2]